MIESKMTLYHEIHKLKRLGFNISQIKRKVGVDRDSIRSTKKREKRSFKAMLEKDSAGKAIIDVHDQCMFLLWKYRSSKSTHKL